MHDAMWQTLVQGAFALMMTVALVLAARRTRLAVEVAASRAAAELAKSANALSARQDDSDTKLKENVDLARASNSKLDVIATLVNSQTRILLATVAAQARRIAQLTGAAEDAEVAAAAEQRLVQHDAQQRKVDNA